MEMQLLINVIEPWLADDGVDATAHAVTLKLLDGTTATYRGRPETVARQLSAAHARVDGLLERCPPWLVEAPDVRRALTRGGIVAVFCR